MKTQSTWLVALLGLAMTTGCQSLGTPAPPSQSPGIFNGGFFDAFTGSPKKRKLTAAEEEAAEQLAAGLAKGREMERQGNLVKARETYEKLIQRAPKQPEAYHRLGVVANRQLRHREAQELFMEAFSLGANSADLHADLGYCFYLQGKLAEAERATAIAVQMERRNERFRNNLGLIYGQQGRYREALDEFRMAGSEADAMHNLAFIYISQNRVDLAKSCLQQGLLADHQHEKTRQTLEKIEMQEHLPDDLRNADELFMADRGTVPYLEGGIANAGGAEGGRVESASYAASAVTPRHASNHYRGLYNEARGKMSRPTSGE